MLSPGKTISPAAGIPEFSVVLWVGLKPLGLSPVRFSKLIPDVLVQFLFMSVKFYGCRV